MNMPFQAAEPQPLPVASRTRRARHHPRPGRLIGVSLLLALSWAGVALFAVGAWGLWGGGNTQEGLAALTGMVLFTLGRASVFILGRHLNCTLCHGPMLEEKRCRKHVDAFRIAPLSYRSSAVVSLLSTGGCRCMYCGTPYRLRK